MNFMTSILRDKFLYVHSGYESKVIGMEGLTSFFEFRIINQNHQVNVQIQRIQIRNPKIVALLKKKLSVIILLLNYEILYLLFMLYNLYTYLGFTHFSRSNLFFDLAPRSAWFKIKIKSDFSKISCTIVLLYVLGIQSRKILLYFIITRGGV